MTQIINDGVITDLEPDILECEVKWALESIIMNKASGGDGIPVELFQILKDNAVKVLHPICQQIWKTRQWPQDWKRSVFIPVSKKGNGKVPWTARRSRQSILNEINPEYSLEGLMLKLTQWKRPRCWER